MRTDRNIEKKIEEMFRYKWEFLRRRKGYEEDYERYSTLSEEANTMDNEGYYTKDHLRAMSKILKRHNISYMPNPRVPKHAELMRLYNSAVVKKRECSLPREWILEEVSCKDPKVFLVDIWRDKEIILHEMSEWIDRIRGSENKKILRQVTRLRYGEYKRYLKVYDLKNQGWSWDKLANKFYPKDSGGLNYARLKVRRDYKSCKKLIDGGLDK